jgi:hypothetical protein
MSEFKKFRRKQIAELRPVTDLDIKACQADKEIQSIRDTEFKVSVSDVELSEYNKLLQVNNVPLTNAVLKSAGNTLTPRIATIAEIISNFNAWESTLVRVSNVSVTGGATLSGNRTLNDGTGTIAMFTGTTATFSGLATPTVPVTLTAIVSDFNAKQLLMRNAGDIQ